MNINLYIVEKGGKKSIETPMIEHYIKLCRPWAKVTVHPVFDKKIAKAQDATAQQARRSYTEALAKYMGQGYSIALDPLGEMVDSHRFSSLLEGQGTVNFFIGGAYGFEREFLEQSNKTVSFGRITLSHRLVKVVLLEQIFRGLSLIHNHPYHK